MVASMELGNLSNGAIKGDSSRNEVRWAQSLFYQRPLCHDGFHDEIAHHHLVMNLFSVLEDWIFLLQMPFLITMV